MSIIGGLLYPNIRTGKERIDDRTPYGLLKITIEAFGYRRGIAIRDMRHWPYQLESMLAMSSMPVPIGIMTFRAWEMTVWKPEIAK